MTGHWLTTLAAGTPALSHLSLSPLAHAPLLIAIPDMGVATLLHALSDNVLALSTSQWPPVLPLLSAITNDLPLAGAANPASSGITQADPLAAMRPLHAPPPIPWWPPAPGWWLLLATLLLTLIAAGLLFLQWRQRTAPTRAALMELRTIANLPHPGKQAAKLNGLLKRYALTCLPHQQTASLSGEPWLRFLDATGGRLCDENAFSKGVGRLLLELPYANSRAAKDSTDPTTQNASQELTALTALCENWIRANRPPLFRRH